jgi:tRNA-specific 2-thiouridylase
MSGGVDSSMCAHILKNQGYDVTGLYMHNWNHQEETQEEVEFKPMPQQLWEKNQQNQYTNTTFLTTENPSTESSSLSSSQRTARIRPKVCTSERDRADVQAVCAQVGIPALRLDFSRQYWNQVFEVMLHEYENGRTPNPDVACNREIKFGELIDWCYKNGGLGKDRHQDSDNRSKEGGLLGWDYLATGHYARVIRDSSTGKAKLLRALDSNKDQTYYLSTLPEKVLRNAIFPLAQFDKPTVKKMALSTGLDQLKNAALKKESMGICFVGQRRRFGEFLEEYLDSNPGPVKVNSLDGQIIGEHKGLFRYTIGQASGIAYGPQK